MSFETVVANIDAQLARLQETLTQCEAQLAVCDQTKQPFLEREIEALKVTQAKLEKSKQLATSAHMLRAKVEQPAPPPIQDHRIRNTIVILVLGIVAAFATLTLL
ncbi:hypothetical protein QWY82_19715 [Simiduia curdlanivorans]|uniref:Uncharacterized protein n=1 Tax=Simiduia curdlanivorans TaxID=1492769 RepID=A0ABV8V545_9GAMM|nr:hypothetical protein [Simiduia curdlanivorans]MDN3641037.1 hypothetical protein [Simiduia curdlanivorans]